MEAELIHFKHYSKRE